MKVSKEKAVVTFNYPYQLYGISFALDEINYEDLYKVFIRYCSRYDGFAFSILSENTEFSYFTKNKQTVRSQIDKIFSEVLALESDAEGFCEFGTIESDNGVKVHVCFSKLSDTSGRVTKENSFAAPVILFEFKLSVHGEDRPKARFLMTVTKEQDLKQGLPNWR